MTSANCTGPSLPQLVGNIITGVTQISGAIITKGRFLLDIHRAIHPRTGILFRSKLRPVRGDQRVEAGKRSQDVVVSIAVTTCLPYFEVRNCVAAGERAEMLLCL